MIMAEGLITQVIRGKYISMARKSIQERLLVGLTVSSDGCWNSSRIYNGNRYGILSVKGKREKAHRVSWKEFKGPIPHGMMVLHKCDNPMCINPDHLFLGTQEDNMRDARNKGRLKPIPPCPSHLRARGDRNGIRKNPGIVALENNPRSKVSNKQRSEIAEKRRNGAMRQDLAKEYGLSENQIRRICLLYGVGNIYPNEWTPERRMSFNNRRV